MKMNEDEIKKIIDDEYDKSKEESIWSMARDFYSKKMMSTAILVWVWAIIFFAGATYCGIKFFQTNQMKYHILYAALFVCFVHGIGLMKIFAWEMIHRNSIKREIKRLELRIAELSNSITEKS
jgi:uncharacterized membrane protein YbjE (DUF340 family)